MSVVWRNSLWGGCIVVLDFLLLLLVCVGICRFLFSDVVCVVYVVYVVCGVHGVHGVRDVRGLRGLRSVRGMRGVRGVRTGRGVLGAHIAHGVRVRSVRTFCYTCIYIYGVSTHSWDVQHLDMHVALPLFLLFIHTYI